MDADELIHFRRIQKTAHETGKRFWIDSQPFIEVWSLAKWQHPNKKAPVSERRMVTEREKPFSSDPRYAEIMADEYTMRFRVYGKRRKFSKSKYVGWKDKARASWKK